ncbi:MAG: gamma-glutamylcyclotransferase [Dokdonella sp.]
MKEANPKSHTLATELSLSNPPQHRQLRESEDRPHLLRQIASSKGPSGLNRDYFAHLADALRALGESDSHIDRIEQELMTLPAE